MKRSRIINPHDLETVRDNLSLIVEKISVDGRHAHPLVFGRGNEPEAVLISAEQYRALVEYFDDLLDEEKLNGRLANAPEDDEMALTTVEDLAAELGIEMKNR